MKVSEITWKIAFNLCADGLHKRFVAGDTIEDAIKKAKELEKKGIYPMINILGERAKNKEEADQFCQQYLNLIIKLSLNGPRNAHIPVKPSQLGLEISEDLYRINLGKILRMAQAYLPEAMVEIDREGHQYAMQVRKVALDCAKVYIYNQRICCQINLKETPDEIKQFIEAGISVRLCKGMASEGGDIKKEGELRKIFLEQALILAEKGNKPAIATHDLYLIDRLEEKENLEFQVLLGIENKKMEKLAKRGKVVGFYIPCGPDWRPYGERRGKVILKIWWRNSFYRVGRFLAGGFEKVSYYPWVP